jgi:hypothetical protein
MTMVMVPELLWWLALLAMSGGVVLLVVTELELRQLSKDWRRLEAEVAGLNGRMDVLESLADTMTSRRRLPNRERDGLDV